MDPAGEFPAKTIQIQDTDTGFNKAYWRIAKNVTLGNQLFFIRWGYPGRVFRGIIEANVIAPGSTTTYYPPFTPSLGYSAPATEIAVNTQGYFNADYLTSTSYTVEFMVVGFTGVAQPSLSGFTEGVSTFTEAQVVTTANSGILINAGSVAGTATMTLRMIAKNSGGQYVDTDITMTIS